MKDKMKIYARPENCNSLVVKKCNKEIWKKIQKIQTAVLKGTIVITQVQMTL